MVPSLYRRIRRQWNGHPGRPIRKGCLEVYNDYNSNLTNLFCCGKNRPMALLKELGFLPLNSRDDYSVLYKFFSRDEFTDDYLKEELELTQVYLAPPELEAIRKRMRRGPSRQYPPCGRLLQTDPLQFQRRWKVVRWASLRYPTFLLSDLGVFPQTGQCGH